MRWRGNSTKGPFPKSELKRRFALGRKKNGSTELSQKLESGGGTSAFPEV